MRKLLWVLVVLAAAGAGYYYYAKPAALVQDPVAPQAGIEPSIEPTAKPVDAAAPAVAPVGEVPAAVPAVAPAAPAAEGNSDAAPAAPTAAPSDATAPAPAAPAAPATEAVTTDSAVTIGGPFTLTNQNGEAVTDQTYAGKYRLVFFGFSNCPAICPTALTNITNVLKALGPDADKIVPMFITVDPARDTPAALKTYLQNFDARISALTGTQEQAEAAAKAYKVFAKKVEAPGMEGYMMDHLSFIYIMDKEGKYLAHLDHNEATEAMLAKIRPLTAQ